MYVNIQYIFYLNMRFKNVLCVFVYQDDQKGEDDIVQKKAALLEKRLRREKEMHIKKQQQETEIEQKKGAARYENTTHSNTKLYTVHYTMHTKTQTYNTIIEKVKCLNCNI